MTDERLQTFSERLPIVAKMVESAFNGDAPDDAPNDGRVAFALIAYQRGGEDANAATMISNVHEPHKLIALLLTIIAQFDEDRIAHG